MRKVFFALLGLVVLGAAVGGVFIYRLYNKPHRDIAAEAPAFTFTETELVDRFTEDAPGTDREIKDRVIRLGGMVRKTEASGGLMHLTFDGGGAYMVAVSLDSTEHARPQAGTDISVKGLYVGFIEGDTGFGIPGEIKIKNGFVQ